MDLRSCVLRFWSGHQRQAAGYSGAGIVPAAAPMRSSESHHKNSYFSVRFATEHAPISLLFLHVLSRHLHHVICHSPFDLIFRSFTDLIEFDLYLPSDPFSNQAFSFDNVFLFCLLVVRGREAIFGIIFG